MVIQGEAFLYEREKSKITINKHNFLMFILENLVVTPIIL